LAGDSINEKIETLGQEVEIRKQAERDLRKLNEKLEQRVKERTAEIARQKYILDTFMANVPDSIYFKDRESRITHANMAHASAMWFSDPADEIGKSDFDFFPADQARPKYEQEQAIMQTGQPLLAAEEPDAGGRWSLTTKMPLRDEHGAIIGTFAISRDITELKQTQQELAAAYQEVQILNTQLQQDNLRMSAELDVSRRIQQMVLPAPEELQQIEGLDIVGYMKPAEEVGGDYYDVLTVNGMLHIGIGDVTGHGLESGVLMLMTQTAIRTLIEHGETDPVAFLSTLNRVILKNAQRMQVDKTLTLACVHYHHGMLKLIGQHEELLVVRAGGTVERVDTLHLGFPIGMVDEIAQ
jgi:PAS domain S-box-containing protein